MNTPTALEGALELTRAMLVAARAAEWERLTELEAQRQPLVMQAHAPTAASYQQLGEILLLDTQLCDLVGRARDEVAGQWQRESSRAQAIAAYAAG